MALIMEKLRTCIPSGSPNSLLTKTPSTGPLTDASMTRMEYDRFDDLITTKYHVVVKNWPLPVFCNPSAVASRIELQSLYNSWKSGSTYFQQLTHEEMEVWESNRFSSRMELMPPPAEPVPALASPQPPTEMTLLSELPCQESVLAPTPSIPTLVNVPLAPITNIASGSALLPSPAPNPDTIAMMIRADPALQNVDPALIAMGIMQDNQRQATVTTTTTPQIEQPLNHILPINGSKRRWQEVITPLSFDAPKAKKIRKSRKGKDGHNLPAVQDSENRV
jgi:hypothetical protein